MYIGFLLSNSVLSGLISIDQTAAFPRISHRHMRWALRKMRLPTAALHLFDALYTGGRSFISIQGKIYDDFETNNGVRQGCPSSMILFILCVDPIIR